jgi:hypothetical protein
VTAPDVTDKAGVPADYARLTACGRHHVVPSRSARPGGLPGAVVGGLPPGPRGSDHKGAGSTRSGWQITCRALSQHPCSHILHTVCTSSASYVHASPVLFERGSRQGVSRSPSKGGKMRRFLTVTLVVVRAGFPGIRGKRPGIRPAGRQSGQSGRVPYAAHFADPTPPRSAASS